MTSGYRGRRMGRKRRKEEVRWMADCRRGGNVVSSWSLGDHARLVAVAFLSSSSSPSSSPPIFESQMEQPLCSGQTTSCFLCQGYELYGRGTWSGLARLFDEYPPRLSSARGHRSILRNYYSVSIQLGWNVVQWIVEKSFRNFFFSVSSYFGEFVSRSSLDYVFHDQRSGRMISEYISIRVI